MKTKQQAWKYLDKMEGYWWDWDGVYGAQCFDEANFYWYFTTGRSLKGLYAKDIPFVNDFKGYATVIKNYDAFIPQKGDLVIFPGTYGGGAGHVAIVLSANLNTFVSLDQNWHGGGRNNPPELAQRITHYYEDNMYFIRPHYSETATVAQKVKTAVTTVKPPKFKPKKIMLVAGHGYADPGAVGNNVNERDFIRKYITPNIAKYLRDAGHTVSLYGGSKQSQDMYQDTAYGYRLGDKKKYGMYWVKNQGYDCVLEIHLDAAGSTASGGHTIISSAFNADTIDNNIQNSIKSAVGQIRGVTGRNDLLNANVSAEINQNYRLAELGFITSKKDMDWIKKNYLAYSKTLASAIHGKPIGGVVAGSKKPKPKTKPKQVCPPGYTYDKNGVPYKKETGRYTVTTVSGNNVRRAYTTKAEITGVLTNGQSITYDGAYVVNGYRWITYMSDRGRRYIATGKADEKGNRIDSYGKFSAV